jgi:hypothetical protein
MPSTHYPKAVLAGDNLRRALESMYDEGGLAMLDEVVSLLGERRRWRSARRRVAEFADVLAEMIAARQERIRSER